MKYETSSIILLIQQTLPVMGNRFQLDKLGREKFSSFGLASLRKTGIVPDSFDSG